MSDERPVINDLPWSRADTLLEVLSFLVLVTGWVMLSVLYSRIPESVPTHFNVSGQPDAWGMRESVFLLPVTMTVMYVILTGVSFLSPRIYNYPVKITTGNARVQYTLARRLLRSMKLMVTTILTFLLWWVVQIATGVRRELGPGFLIVTLAGVAFVLSNYVIRARRLR